MGGEAGPSGGPLNAIKQTLLGAEHSGELVPDDVHDALQLQGLHALSLGRIVDIEPTFSAMAQRRLRRQLGGRRKTPMPNLFRAMWIIAYMSIGVGFVGLQGGFADLELRVSIFKSTPTFVYFVLILAVVWIAMRTYAVVRWCLAWLLCGTGLALIIGDQPTPTGLTPWLSEWLPFATLFADFGQDFFQLVIASVTISLVLLTILIFFGVYHIYPRLISCLGRCRGVSKLWSITRVNRHSQRTAADGVVTERLEFTYAPLRVCSFLPWPDCCRKYRHFSYEGELGYDDRGLLVPHGWGTWTDTAKYGERLSGYWQHGLPVGPFRSLELRTGCAFTTLRVAVGSMAASAWNTKTWVPQVAERLRWGVVSVEVSVAGHWIKGLPCATLHAPFEERDANWAVRQLMHIGDCADTACLANGVTSGVTSGVASGAASTVAAAAGSTSGHAGCERGLQSVVVSLAAAPHQLHVAGHRAASVELATSATISIVPVEEGSGGTPCLRVEGGWRRGGAAQEALIWIPGFNASSDVIASAVAQLLALGAFPAHIKPLIFAWPNGVGLTYPLAEELARSACMRAHVCEFFRSVLEDAGIDQIHVLVHSMGSQLFFNALPDLVNLFASRNAKLASCILLNADSPLETFVDTSYPLLASICQHITVYADTHDMALFYSKFISHLSACLPFVPDIATRNPLGR